MERQILTYPDVEYYSTIKRNEAQTHATEQKNLENIMLSERNKKQKVNIVWFPFYAMRGINKSIEEVG